MKKETPTLTVTALRIIVRIVASIFPLLSNPVTVMRCSIYSVTTTVPDACGISANVQLG